MLNSVTATSERQRIKHIITSTHNLSQRQAQRLGIRHLTQRATQVEDAIETVKHIRSKHNYFAKLEQKAFIHSQGLDFEEYDSSDSDSSEWDSSDEDVVAEERPSSHSLVASLDIEETLANSSTEVGINHQDHGHVETREIQPISSTGEYTSQHKQGDSIQSNPHDLHASNAMLVLGILKETEYNWFAFVAYLEPIFSSQGYTPEDFDQFLVNFASKLQDLGLTDEEFRLTEQSREVYLAEMLAKETRAETIDDEDDNIPKNETSTPIDGEAIKRKMRQIKDKARKKACAEIQATRLLCTKSGSRMDAIHKRHPDIGEVMEKIVAAADVGADKWRRTGVYTFSGDTKKEKRITFKSLTEKLSNHYGEKISYGTVVQLCVPRNKRRKSMNRYKGVANVKYQRSRKGFDMKFNPDVKWSRSLYKCLDTLQNDGQHILLLNRDDQAGFRLVY